MASRREVIQETNARYWVSTGYKLGEALDPKDPTDRMHAQRWLETYRDLAHQNARGTLTLLHKDPSFAQSLDNAINAYRIEQSTRAGDPRYVEAQRAKHQALSDAGLWQEMIMARGTSAVSGAALVDQAADPLAQELTQETNAEFVRETGRSHPEDFEMYIVWLTFNYSVVTRHLNQLRMFSDPASSDSIRRLAEYRAQLNRLFADNPSWDHRAREAMQRIKLQRRAQAAAGMSY